MRTLILGDVHYTGGKLVSQRVQGSGGNSNILAC